MSRRAMDCAAPAEPSAPSAVPPSIPVWHLAFVAMFAFALYLPTARFSFVWDDTFFIVRNPAVQSPRYLWEYFTNARSYSPVSVPGMYRPLRNVSYLVDYLLVGLHPPWWHLHNALLHAANAALVLWVIHLLLGSQSSSTCASAALAGTLIWAAHPVHTEAVAWVKSRDELLFSLFYLAAFGYAWRALVTSRLTLRRTTIVAALFGASLLSKEMAATLPLTIATAWWLVAKPFVRNEADRGRGAWSLLATLGLVLAAFVYARHHVLGATAQCPRLSGSFVTDMLTMVRAAARYITLTIAPLRQLADYRAFGVTRSLAEARWWYALAILLGALALVALAWRYDRRAGFGLTWFWIALAPVSNLIPTMQFLAERFLYLPLVGPAIAVAAVLERTWSNSPQLSASTRARSACITTATWLTLFVGLTAVRIHVWKNEPTLIAATYLDSPPCGRIAQNLAVTLTNLGQPHQALAILNEILSDTQGVYRDADAVVLESTLAQALVLSGRPQEALAHADRALAMEPNYDEAWQTKGLAYGRMGDPKRALACFVEALRRNPTATAARENIAVALRELGRSDLLEAFERGAISLDALAPPLTPPPPVPRPW